jgi:hypothetical protein
MLILSQYHIFESYKINIYSACCWLRPCCCLCPCCWLRPCLLVASQLLAAAPLLLVIVLFCQ